MSIRGELFKRAKKAEAEVERLREMLRISYPATPVDCLISEVREIVYYGSADDFDVRVAQFRNELEAEAREERGAVVPPKEAKP